MSLRAAINAKCRDCICDPLDAGSAAQQIACCVVLDCPLHPVRPITTTAIPVRLLGHYQIAPEQLDAKARALVRVSDTVPESGQHGHIPSVEMISGGGL
jgi:hypothetical protein